MFSLISNKKTLIIISILILSAGFFVLKNKPKKETGGIPSPAGQPAVLPKNIGLGGPTGVAYEINIKPANLPGTMASYQARWARSQEGYIQIANKMGFMTSPTILQGKNQYSAFWSNATRELSVADSGVPRLTLYSRTQPLAPISPDDTQSLLNFYKNQIISIAGRLEPLDIVIISRDSVALEEYDQANNSQSPEIASIVSLTYTLEGFPVYFQKNGDPGLYAYFDRTNKLNKISLVLPPDTLTENQNRTLIPIDQARSALSLNRGVLVEAKGSESVSGGLFSIDYQTVNITGVKPAYYYFEDTGDLKPIYLFNGTGKNESNNDTFILKYAVSAF